MIISKLLPKFNSSIFICKFRISKPLLSTVELDKKILSITTSSSINYLIGPLVGFTDAFWISKLGNSLQVAGQGYADNIYNLLFSVFYFFSSFITPEVAQLNNPNQKDQDKMINLISMTVILSFIFGSIVTIISHLLVIPIAESYINNSQISLFCQKYLRIRSLSYPFAMFNCTVFAVMRGMFLFKKAFMLNFYAQIINMIGNPILMKLIGIEGIAIVSVFSEIICSCLYSYFLIKNHYFKLSIKNIFQNIHKIGNIGILIQVRNVCYKLLYMILFNQILKIDHSGTILASYIISFKIIELGSIGYNGLGTVGFTLIPSQKNISARQLIETRLKYWSQKYSLSQILFVGSFYLFSKYLSSELVVVNYLHQSLPFILGLIYFQGLGNIQDGILQGYQKYTSQTITSFLTLILGRFLLYQSNNFQQIWFSMIMVSFWRLGILKWLKKKY